MVNMLQSEADKGEFVRMAQNKVDWSADDLYNSFFHKVNDRNNAHAGGSESMKTGQIESMNIPADWVKRDGVNLRAGAGLVEYHPAGNNDVRLNSYYRGNRIGDDAAKAFKDCLNQAPHQIAKGSEELKALSDVINDKSGDFNIAKAFTEELNGKKVLVLEGEYKDTEHTTSRTMYVDSDGTGSAVQEISYTAPGSQFKAHLPEAEKSFKSILWQYSCDE